MRIIGLQPTAAGAILSCRLKPRVSQTWRRAATMRLSGRISPCLASLESRDHTGCSSTASTVPNRMHVHIRRERNQAKFWLDPVVLAWNRGFSPRELNEIRRIIVENQTRIIEAWHEHCGTDGNDDSAG
jgi:hypothetical protein